MKRIGAEIRYDNAYQTAQAEMELVSKKPTKERLDSIRELLKEMDKCIAKIEQDFCGNSKINKKDAQNKVAMYKQQRNVIKHAFEAADLALKQKELCQRTPNPQGTGENGRLKEQNKEMAEKQLQQLKNVRKMLNEAATVTKDTVQEFHNQQEVIGNIQGDMEEADGELSMINEFMGIISNRNLLTRLILLALALFLGLADLIILILKIK